MAVKTHWFLAIVFPLVCLLLLPTFATAEGWSLPGWGKSKSSKSSWSWPGTSNKNAQSKFASKRSQPSTWDKVSKGTANSWDKTTSAINPWKKETKTPARPTGARRPANLPGKAEPKTTWYNPSTWFGSDEKPQKSKSYEPPGSVNEFLSQPRVPY